MSHGAHLAGLEELRRNLEAAVRIARRLDQEVMARVADEEPDRWNLLHDSLSAALVPGDMGSVQQLLTALSAALDDR